MELMDAISVSDGDIVGASEHAFVHVYIVGLGLPLVSCFSLNVPTMSVKDHIFSSFLLHFLAQVQLLNHRSFSFE